MRTTITISDEVYREAKARAAMTSQSVSQLIEDAVRMSLRAAPPTTEPPELPTFGGSGTLPGVDLADHKSLREVMDADATLDALR